MTHGAWVLYFAIWAVVIGFAWVLCRVAAKPAPPIPTRGRRSYAEGRPTMPSEIEPELERERRTR
jgi:hypothetical protein